MLSLKSVEKVFGGLRAIGGVSFDVEPQQIFGLIGPNGAGKTTLFNCVTGHYRPDGGDVLFDGRSILGMSPYQVSIGGIGRTFQNIRLFGDMSVIHNVMAAGQHRTKSGVLGAMLRTKRYGEEEAALRKKAEELLDIFELKGMADEPSSSLSYGVQRRLEIARALMLEPKILLLDEPAAGLNSKEANVLKEQIRWLRDKFALTIVLVEHNMQVVMGVCEMVHCVDHGETIAHGTPEEVRNHPAVLAAYLGEDETISRVESDGAPDGDEAERDRVEGPEDDPKENEESA